MTRPVFTLPRAPQGWSGPTTELIRIVDPAGEAIAWLEPATASCVGYSVRGPSGMAHDTRLDWQHIIVPLPAGDMHRATRGWRFMGRDPAECTFELEPEFGVADGPVSMTASLDDGALTLAYQLPATPSTSPVHVVFAFSSAPLIEELPSPRALDEGDLASSSGETIGIIHSDSIHPSQPTTIDALDGRVLSIVAFEALPGLAIANPGSASAHVIRIAPPLT